MNPRTYCYIFVRWGKYRGTTWKICGPGSSVGIVTDYGLDGAGSNAGGD